MAELTLQAGGAALHVLFADGTSALLTAAALRAACRCAPCRAAERDGLMRELSAVAIVASSEIGAYAVQLRFSDGHERGIYPYVYLRELAA